MSTNGGWIKLHRKSLDSQVWQKATKSKMHKRTPEIIASQYVGMMYFTEYAKDVGAIPPGWLREQARMKRILCLFIGHKMRFNIEAVEKAIAKIAAKEGDNGYD